jgi:hypothetical protein
VRGFDPKPDYERHPFYYEPAQPNFNLDQCPRDILLLIASCGMRRSNENFWSIFDTINSIHIANNPVQSGALDLTRYALDEK